MKAAEKLVQVAEQKVGYLEKEAIKTANAGSNNFTKYARGMNKAGKNSRHFKACCWDGYWVR